VVVVADSPAKKVNVYDLKGEKSSLSLSLRQEV